MRRKKVLLADNDSNGCSEIGKIFFELGLHVTKASDGLSAFDEIVRDRYDLVITELNLPQMNGINLLKRIKEVNESLPVILISDNARVGEAVEAMKLGAYDFILKPLSVETIEIIVSQISNSLTMTGEDKSEARFTPLERKPGHLGRDEKTNKFDQDLKPSSKLLTGFNIITKNREMNRLLQEARDIADSRASVFIQGESGTGKELFARYIHHHSNRRDRPYVAINCSALPETLLESEMFGHEKGSFTGAITRKKGKFEIANHGTMLLDEISEMDIQLQSKLLRVLQEREIDRVGGIGPIPVDVRIIATTNTDIEKQLGDGKFREDLFYRLNVVPFHLPPLRDRKDDIPLLVDYLIEKYNMMDKRSVKGLTEEAMQALISMSWKGNVRELENIIERAVLMCKGDLIDTKKLFINEKDRLAEDTRYTFEPTVSLKEMERKVIFHALDKTNGNRTHAAETLGISVRTLRNKLNEYREKMEAQ